MFYQIPKRAQYCLENGEPFNENEEIITILMPKKIGFDRKDLCLKCFERCRENFINNEISYWKVKIPSKPKKEKSKKSGDFLKLLRSGTLQEDLSYLICLFLERQKLLHRRKEKEDQIIFECLDTEEIFVAKKTAISQESLKTITQDIAF
jgi:hypothetical protein